MSSISSLTGSSSSAANSATTSSSAAAASSSATSALGGLSESDFLQLLVAQMQNQDPTSPMSGTDFMSELAQFSTVEGVNQLDTDFAAQSLTQSTS